MFATSVGLSQVAKAGWSLAGSSFVGHDSFKRSGLTHCSPCPGDDYEWEFKVEEDTVWLPRELWPDCRA